MRLLQVRDRSSDIALFQSAILSYGMPFHDKCTMLGAKAIYSKTPNVENMIAVPIMARLTGYNHPEKASQSFALAAHPTLRNGPSPLIS